MKDLGHEAQHTTGKRTELEEVWIMNTDQESWIMAMEGYHSKLLLLHKHAWDGYKVERSEHREMHRAKST